MPFGDENKDIYIYTSGLLLQCTRTLTVQLVRWSITKWSFIISSKCKLLSPCYSWKRFHLVVNNNHSLYYEQFVPKNVFLLDAYSINYILWDNLNLNKIIQNGDRLVELMFSVLVSYLEDWWIEPWLKPKTIKFVFTVQNYEISKGTFQRSFLFYLRFSF